MGDKTTIEVSKTTRKELKVFKAERDLTYDEAIGVLLRNCSGE